MATDLDHISPSSGSELCFVLILVLYVFLVTYFFVSGFWCLFVFWHFLGGFQWFLMFLYFTKVYRTKLFFLWLACVLSVYSWNLFNILMGKNLFSGKIRGVDAWSPMFRKSPKIRIFRRLLWTRFPRWLMHQSESNSMWQVRSVSFSTHQFLLKKIANPKLESIYWHSYFGHYLCFIELKWDWLSNHYWACAENL